jgi:hypothetical protein
MEYDEAKVDEAVLALMFLNFFGDHGMTRAWKSFPWEAMDRLHEMGYISDPKTKAKSIVMTEEGEAMAKDLFSKLFGT